MYNPLELKNFVAQCFCLLAVLIYLFYWFVSRAFWVSVKLASWEKRILHFCNCFCLFQLKSTYVRGSQKKLLIGKQQRKNEKKSCLIALFSSKTAPESQRLKASSLTLTASLTITDRNVSTGATSMTLVAPKFSYTLTISSTGRGADSAHHCRGCN